MDPSNTSVSPYLKVTYCGAAFSRLSVRGGLLVIPSCHVLTTTLTRQASSASLSLSGSSSSSLRVTKVSTLAVVLDAAPAGSTHDGPVIDPSSKGEGSEN